MQQRVRWDAELGQGLWQLMWGAGMPWGVQPWGSLDAGSTLSILAPQELYPPLHFCTQLLLEPLSIPPSPGGYPGMMRPILGCHFGASCAGLVLDVPLVRYLPCWFGASCAVGLVLSVLRIWCWPCQSSGTACTVGSYCPY